MKIMKTILTKTMNYFTLAATLLAVPAYGQTINPSEDAAPYANVRGWSVYVMSDGRGIYSCRAVRGQGYNNEMMIEYDGSDETWRILVQATRPSGGGAGAKGAGVYYDGRFVDRQIYFGAPGYDGSSDRYAKLDLNAYGLDNVKSGNNIRIDINGEGNRTWSLSGTTAAILKVAECAGQFGIAPAGMAAQAPSVPPAQSQQPLQQVFSANDIGYVVYPNGDYSHTGNGQWVEQIFNGPTHYFSEYGSTDDSIFLTDDSRNIQIWIDFHNNQFWATNNYDTNSWNPIYEIMCFDAQKSRSC